MSTSASTMELRVKEIYTGLFGIDVNPESIASDEELFGPHCRFGMDSMDVLRLIAELRERFSLELSEIATETFRTASSIAEFLQEHEAKKSAVAGGEE